MQRRRSWTWCVQAMAVPTYGTYATLWFDPDNPRALGTRSARLDPFIAIRLE